MSVIDLVFCNDALARVSFFFFKLKVYIRGTNIQYTLHKRIATRCANGRGG